MRTVVVGVSVPGAALAERLAQALPAAEVRLHTADDPVGVLLPRLFRDPTVDGLVVVLAVGATVRLLAGCLGDKRTDPAVVAVDDGGTFAVPLVSGHQGGANALAARVAAAIGARPVITSGSDVAGLPAVDLIGAEAGWRVEASQATLRQAAAAVVNGQAVGVFQDAGERLELPFRRVPDLDPASLADLAAVLIVSDRLVPAVHPVQVVYRPRSLVVGIGCSTDATADDGLEALDLALARADLARDSVGLLATVDRRRDAPAVQALSHRLGVPVRAFSVAELAAVVGAPTPSERVAAAVGTPGVCEPAALLASGAVELLVAKVKTARATAAIARVPSQERASGGVQGRAQRPPWPAERIQPIAEPSASGGRLYLVGLGPGSLDHLTLRAAKALQASEAIVGYGPYVDLVDEWFPDPSRRLVRGQLGQEPQRAAEAIRLACDEQLTVALVSSGDATIYGMGGPLFRALQERGWQGDAPPVEVVPGVTAALSANALLGAPLADDLALISLSDLLTPWPAIAERLEAAARADFVLALYNPASVRRRHAIREAQRILLQHRPPSTPVALVRNALRPDSHFCLTTLADFGTRPDVDMQTLVLVGNQTTSRVGHGLVSRRTSA